MQWEIGRVSVGRSVGKIEDENGEVHEWGRRAASRQQSTTDKRTNIGPSGGEGPHQNSIALQTRGPT